MPRHESPVEQTVHAGSLNAGDSELFLQTRATNSAVVVDEQEFDVVGLQEVTPHHEAAFKARLLAHKPHFHNVYDHQDSGLLTLVNQLTFPQSKSYRPKGWLADAALQITELTRHDGQELIFVNGHMPQAIYMEFSRIIQMILLDKHLKKNYSGLPVVIVHDTNSTKAAPLNLITQAIGYRSVHKVVHGKEPPRTYPSKFGDELLSSGKDGSFYEILGSKVLRRAGITYRSLRGLEDDGWDSPYAGCDVDKAYVNDLVDVHEASLFADDRQEGMGRISDHVGLRFVVSLIMARQSAKLAKQAANIRPGAVVSLP